jgi:lysophospholipid acyltransferase (LPLAT)-like uncharacterized protein
MTGGALARLKGTLVPRVGGRLVTTLLRTARFELIAGQRIERDIVEAGVPAIYVLWHGRLLPCAYNWRGHGFGTLISQNRDGERITPMVEAWGYRVIRGSTSRGGTSALLSIVRALEGGVSVAITPDGPRGPREKMKLGPIRAAAKTGVPIVPVAAGAVRAWYLGRWDRFLVPQPFTWIPVGLGEPHYVGGGATAGELAASAARVEAELARLTQAVDEAAGAARR